MAKHWTERKIDPRDWRKIILSGSLAEELAGDEGFSPAAEVFVGSGDPTRRNLLGVVQDIAPEWRGPDPDARERKALGDLAMAVARGADWSGADALWELPWLIQAGRFGVGREAFEILEARAPEGLSKRCSEKIAAKMGRAALDSPWEGAGIARSLSWLRETPIPEAAGRFPQARALVESQLGSKGALVRMDPRFATIARLLSAAPSLKGILGEESFSEAFLDSLRRGAEDWVGLEDLLRGHLSALPRNRRAEWAGKAIEALSGLGAAERADLSEAVSALEAALADREAKEAPAAGAGRRAL